MTFSCILKLLFKNGKPYNISRWKEYGMGSKAFLTN